eukprot:3867475-Rhodomonas_salina.2
MVVTIPRNAQSSRPPTRGQGCGRGWRQTPRPPSMGWKGSSTTTSSTNHSISVDSNSGLP